MAWIFDSGQWRDSESARLRAGFRERYREFDDGRAAERVVRSVMLREAVPLPGAPATTDASAMTAPLVSS